MKLHTTCVLERPWCHALLTLVPIHCQPEQCIVAVSCNKQAQITPKAVSLVNQALEVWGENHNRALVHVSFAMDILDLFPSGIFHVHCNQSRALRWDPSCKLLARVFPSGVNSHDMYIVPTGQIDCGIFQNQHVNRLGAYTKILPVDSCWYSSSVSTGYVPNTVQLLSM